MLGGFFRARKIAQLKRRLLADRGPGRRELDAFAELAPPEELIATLIQVAEQTNSTDAIEMLGKLPPSEKSIEALCKLIQRPKKTYERPDWSQSYYAMIAMGRLDYERKHPKHNAALMRAACECEWSQDSDSQAARAFKELITGWPPSRDLSRLLNCLNSEIIPEFKRRALSAPISYPHGARLEADRFLLFLEEIAKKDHLASDAKAALDEIQTVFLHRRAQALPNVLHRALTAERYEEVASMAQELKDLAVLGVDGAAKALAQFNAGPARRLPKATYHTITNVDYEGPYDCTLQGDDEIRSTAELGQGGR
jgi:hypothetical protein